ncbi:MAG: 50S ribosomal protein L15 [Candidatus Omnitrophota bacterium]
MDLSNIKVKIKNKKPKRLGRGSGSGTGKTSGRGHKGAGQRKGKKLPYIGFRGGNLPFYRIIPKRGFTPPRCKEYQIVNLGDIQARIKDSKEVTPEILMQFNLIKDDKKPVKILGRVKDKFTLKMAFKADKFSSSAKKIIEAAGGKAIVAVR